MLEAKAGKDNLSSICGRCSPVSWSFLDNSGSQEQEVARIILGWDPSCLQVTLVFSSSQLLCVHVNCLSTNRLFFASFVYGANSWSDRRPLWDSTRSLSSAIGDNPWIQMGDFNVALRSSERVGVFDSAAASEFCQCLIDINMEELVSRGCWFTWSNKRGGGGDNLSRIDRVVINSGWLDLFPESEAIAQVPGISDHCSMLVSVFEEPRCKKPSRFFNFLMKHYQFKDLALSSWVQP